MPRLAALAALPAALVLAACAGAGPGGGTVRIETSKEIVRAEEPIVEATGNSARVFVHGTAPQRKQSRYRSSTSSGKVSKYTSAPSYPMLTTCWSDSDATQSNSR